MLIREADLDFAPGLNAVTGETDAEVTEDDPELVVVLGGDGTMLRAFHENLGRGVPVLGVNFGRFGFLASMQPDELETGLQKLSQDTEQRLT